MPLSLLGVVIGAYLLFGVVGMVPARVIMASYRQAVAVSKCAFGKCEFATIRCAILTAVPPVAVRNFDRTGSQIGSMLCIRVLSALVFSLLP
jgi:hypothetical protein